jgi:hypothetical protein
LSDKPWFFPAQKLSISEGVTLTLFNFQLRALADVTPWGNPDQPRLHWFGLTDGWYWLQMDKNNELFRYTPELLDHWYKSYPEKTISSPYVDYYVVRLWEDLLEILPDLLESLPPTLVHMLETEEQISRWQQKTRQWDEENVENEELGTDLWDTYMEATSWWSHRQFNTGYLTASPHLWFWNDGTSIQCFWDNNDLFIKDLPVWTAQRGQIQLTQTQFLEEVDSFHARLFSAMAERIQEAKLSWPHPDVTLDMIALEKEHQDRSQWLARCLERAASRTMTPWNPVIDAISTLERRNGFPSAEM